MNVGLALEIESEIQLLGKVIHELDNYLTTFFSDKSYGIDVENIVIAVILTGSGSEKFHAVRKLKYKKEFRVNIPGHIIELKNLIEYDVKPDYTIFSKLNSDQAKRFIADALITSTDILEQNRRKFSDFDLDKFKHDLTVCLTF